MLKRIRYIVDTHDNADQISIKTTSHREAALSLNTTVIQIQNRYDGGRNQT